MKKLVQQLGFQSNYLDERVFLFDLYKVSTKHPEMMEADFYMRTDPLTFGVAVGIYPAAIDRAKQALHKKTLEELKEKLKNKKRCWKKLPSRLTSIPQAPLF